MRKWILTALAAVLAVVLVRGLALSETDAVWTAGYDNVNDISYWYVNTSKHLIPGADNTSDIGTATLEIRNIYVDGTGTFDDLTIGGNIAQTATATTGYGADLNGSTVTTGAALRVVVDSSTMTTGVAVGVYDNDSAGYQATIDEAGKAVFDDTTVTATATTLYGLDVNGNTVTTGAALRVGVDASVMTTGVAIGVYDNDTADYAFTVDELGRASDATKDYIITQSTAADAIYASSNILVAGVVTATYATAFSATPILMGVTAINTATGEYIYLTGAPSSTAASFASSKSDSTATIQYALIGAR